MTPAQILRKRLAQPEILVLPGGGSPLEIRLIENAGFDAAYVSGYATAALRYGIPDIGLMGYGEIENMILAVRNASTLPVIVDCDTGYGDVANVVRSVRGLERLGVAGIQIEDQVWPKRCGHMDNKVVEPREVAVRKIRAAVEARQNPDTLIVARTDARGSHDINEALARCFAFKEAGADILFVDGPQSLEELELIGAELPGPLLANMSESGLTPIRSAKELQDMGFAIAMFPSTTIRIMIKTVNSFLGDLKQTGDSRAWIDRMASLAETNHALGMNSIREFESNIAEGKL